MNHNQQENRSAPGGRKQQPRNVPSHLEQQARNERHDARESHEKEARHASDEHGTSREPSTNPDKFGKDMPREQQAAAARQGDAGRHGDVNNPARRSDGGDRHSDRRDERAAIDNPSRKPT